MSKSSYWSQIIDKSGKQSDFYKKCTKRTFWQNLTFPHSRCHNRRIGLKSSPNRENRAISIKSGQNVRLGPCGGSFGKISLFRTADVKIVAVASNHPQIGISVRFLQKMHKTHVWGRAEQVLAKCHFLAHQMSKSSYWPQIIAKSEKQCDFYEKCTKRTFWAMRSKFCKISLLSTPVLKIRFL